jgi:hypothetical protein
VPRLVMPILRALVRAVLPVLPAIAAIILLAAAPAMGSKLEMLVMPGPVIEGHAKYEAECPKCHLRFSKETQSGLCLDCHDKVKADVDSGEGFHGRIPGIKDAKCRRCHTDHLGRDADIVHLDPQTFEHDRTDYPLKGAHLRIACTSCHKPDKEYRDAPDTCIGCHKEDDPHQGRLGEKCADCHSEKGWREARFDHDKTDFPLADTHAKVACDMCHPNERYKHVPTTCIGCHRINDVHAGRYGEKCETCHSPKKWKDMVFDHDKDTDYPLTGRHAKVACDACHTGKLYTKKKLDTACHACHANDDEHKGRYGDKCDDCHKTEGWTDAAFDHDGTDFPLKGAHEKVPCRECHRGDAYKEKLGTTCRTCHAADDVHNGQEGEDCQRCHNADDWGKRVVFDHGVTRFPLIGLHATQPCEACHLNAAYRGTDMACIACHKADDTHKNRLGTDCGLCHNPNAWSLWRFDHDTQTEFRLTGAHEGLDCHACHRAPAGDRATLPSACGPCHRQDDVHRGGFGDRCERCHNTEKFDEVTVGAQRG